MGRWMRMRMRMAKQREKSDLNQMSVSVLLKMHERRMSQMDWMRMMHVMMTTTLMTRRLWQIRLSVCLIDEHLTVYYENE